MAKAQQGMRSTQSEAKAPEGADLTPEEIEAAQLAQGDPLPWEADAEADAGKKTKPAPKTDAEKEVTAVNAARKAQAAAVAAFAREESGEGNDDVIYVASAQDGRFNLILGTDVVIRGSYDSSKSNVMFRVPKNLEARADAHTFVVHGRIIKAG